MKNTEYKIDFLLFTDNNSVKSNCGDITFYNQGGTTVLINGTVRLTPFNSLTLSANYGELDTTIYYFSFVPNPGFDNNLIVYRKIYV